MRAALYLRVSTDDQTTENQRRDLEAAAARAGWTVAHVLADNGISGSKGRDHRPGFDQLHKLIVRREIDVVMAWSVDRLGRSMQDLVAFLGELRAVGCDLYLHQQGVDTTTPAGRALFQMLGVFAEFERAIIVERVKAGIARAKAQGKHCGRPFVDGATEQAIRAALATGKGIRAVARECGVGVSVVQRIRAITHPPVRRSVVVEEAAAEALGAAGQQPGPRCLPQRQRCPQSRCQRPLPRRQRHRQRRARPSEGRQHRPGTWLPAALATSPPCAELHS